MAFLVALLLASADAFPLEVSVICSAASGGGAGLRSVYKVTVVK